MSVPAMIELTVPWWWTAAALLATMMLAGLLVLVIAKLWQRLDRHRGRRGQLRLRSRAAWVTGAALVIAAVLVTAAAT